MALNLPEIETGGGFEKNPNVVPMIDILLVLLIIFMMQIPLSRKTMDVQVPPDEPPEQEEQQEPEDQIVLELMADGSYQINQEPVPIQQLAMRLRQIYDNRPKKLILVRTAQNRRYKDVIEAMDIARGSGVQIIGYLPIPEAEVAQ